MTFTDEVMASNAQMTYAPPVCSYNEWDPLEEVIVGVIDGAMVPEWHVTLHATMPREQEPFFREHAGRPFPQECVNAARAELDEFARLLEREGVRVRRPDPMVQARPFGTPHWSVQGGLYSAMPRDVLLVLGDELIEAPMAWRSRYFEIHSYRRLLKEYFERGARWTQAPKPELTDELFDYSYEDPSPGGAPRYVVTEQEPVFDAADFSRCGRDIFYQLSNVTNRFGVRWLQRHLGTSYRLHQLHVEDSHPMHIDATFVPLAPGKVLINPERIRQLPDMFKDWQVLVAPPPCLPKNVTLYMSSRWLSINTLMLDHRRIVVEEHEVELMRALSGWGFEPIPCRFVNFNRFGGSFHCATLDVRRRGQLQCYF